MLKWETFTDAANEAGMSRRDAGIHFKASDVAGRRLGRVVADNAWQKAQSYLTEQLSATCSLVHHFKKSSLH